MKFRKSGEEFSSCHAARKITEENEKKIDCVSLCCIRNGYKCNNLLKITHRDMVSAFSICYFEKYFSIMGNENNNSQFSTVSKARRTE